MNLRIAEIDIYASGTLKKAKRKKLNKLPSAFEQKRVENGP
jgi:hypothetical protein